MNPNFKKKTKKTRRKIEKFDENLKSDQNKMSDTARLFSQSHSSSHYMEQQYLSQPWSYAL